MKDKVLNLLETADWEDIILKLTYHAVWRARRYPWETRNAGSLPRGKTPEDIAFEAIEKVWQETRSWDPDKYPNLLTHLTWIVNSDLEHLFSSMEHKKTIHPHAPDDEQGMTNVLDNYPIPSQTIEGIHTPEYELISREREILEEKAKNKLYEMVKGDSDLELLLYCIEEGFNKPQDIAAQLSWEVSKVNNLKKKLLRRISKISEYLQEENR
ncbi:MAG: hypothetical protein Q7J27_09470 [Syntrophales bacterium]|nr:hypothetical protein [Syntrophales bacterium]